MLLEKQFTYGSFTRHKIECMLLWKKICVSGRVVLRRKKVLVIQCVPNLLFRIHKFGPVKKISSMSLKSCLSILVCLPISELLFVLYVLLKFCIQIFCLSYTIICFTFYFIDYQWITLVLQLVFQVS